MEFSADRRRVLGLMATAGAVAAASAVLPGPAWAKARPVGLEECLALAPRDMAERSAPVARAWKHLRATAATI
ncbi:twin-arginine translocation signal domain-containing protein, partial [Desulfovibrio sp.]